MKARFSSAKEAVTLSDTEPGVKRWQVPFFEQSAPVKKVVDPVEVEALAQSRGFQIGKWEGLEMGKAEAEQLVKHLSGLLDEMAHPFQSLDQVVIRELANMAMLIARQIVRRELTVNSDVVTDIAAEALSTLSSLQGEIEVFLNPGDRKLVQEMAPALFEGKPYKLVDDPDILPGGCRMKTPISYVDASVERQMEMVFGTLIESCEERVQY
ncbi:MAG: hypothetical protein COA29_02285 [Porticoccus sp.]|nr:MAG: hypothetical protein COA29_02285 [Porticoccus sp.]